MKGFSAREKGTVEKNSKRQGVTQLCCSPQGPTARTKDRAGCHDSAAEILAAEDLPLSPSWEPLGIQEGWAALWLSAAKKQPPKAGGVLCTCSWCLSGQPCHRGTAFAIGLQDMCPAIALHLGQFGVGISLPPFWDLAECDSAPSTMLVHRRAEGLEEGWVSLKQSGGRFRSHSAQAVWGWLCCSWALAVALQGSGRCHTVHNDISALLQHLGITGGSACVLSQVLLADIVEGQDTGELCLCLQGPALRLDHCSLRLWEREGDERQQWDEAVWMGPSQLWFLMLSACLYLDRFLQN